MALYIRSVILREFLAEFLGVVVLCVIGNGSVAQQVTSRKGDFLSINIAYGVGVTFGVYVAFGVSGGHINPAVTLSQAVVGKFPWPKVPVFMAAQYLGGFVSAVIVFLVYFDGIHQVDSGVRQVTGANATAGIFATYPQPYVSNWTAFFDQVVGTALLMVGILALTNEKNVSLRVKSLEPLVIGFLVAAIGMSYGVNCGFAINPARDFGPRVFTAIFGYGGEVFYAYHWFFWVPIVGPHVGAIVGTLLYKFLVGMHFAHDLELLERAAAAADDTAARVGKGKATTPDDDSGGEPSTAHGPYVSGGPRSLSRAVSTIHLTVPPQHVIAIQNTMLRQNTYARQNTYNNSPQAQQQQRTVMWQHQKSIPSSAQLAGVDNTAIELVDIPEAVVGEDIVYYTPISDSKRPTI